ncbi:MAG: glycosyltransferase [Planctomycetota bacterium]
MRTAADHATGDVVVIQDAHLELGPADLLTLLEPILSGEAQVCYGTRFAPLIPWAIKRLPTYCGNRVLNFISNRINGLCISDCMVYYKMAMFVERGVYACVLGAVHVVVLEQIAPCCQHV